MSGQCFLPAAKRQGHAELWVEKKRIGTYGFWDFETSVFSVKGIFLSSFEPVWKLLQFLEFSMQFLAILTFKNSEKKFGIFFNN